MIKNFKLIFRKVPTINELPQKTKKFFSIVKELILICIIKMISSMNFTYLEEILYIRMIQTVDFLANTVQQQKECSQALIRDFRFEEESRDIYARVGSISTVE